MVISQRSEHGAEDYHLNVADQSLCVRAMVGAVSYVVSRPLNDYVAPTISERQK
jgi:hypothetical protein